MKVSLIDVDGHNFPNLALMKLSAWHKQQGDQVDWYAPLFSHPDRIYASKVFTFTPDFADYAPSDPEPIKGGTGYDPTIKLAKEIEETAPDYSIYPKFSAAYGFLTRGCIRNYPWCIVPRKEGDLRTVSDLRTIAQGRQQTVLLDNNFLAAPEDFVKDNLTASAKLKIKIDFNQGLDARLVSTKNARWLATATWMRYIRFSCDTTATLRYVESAVRQIRENGYRGQFFVYMLVRDDIADAEFRLRQLINLKVTPFAQPYRDFTGKSQISKEQQKFARFANLKGGKLCLKMKFSEYY